MELETELAVPALVEGLQCMDDYVRRSITGALGWFGEPAVTALIDILRNDERPLMWVRAAQALGRIGPDAKAAVIILIKSLVSENPWFRETSAISLGRIRSNSSEVVPALVNLLIREHSEGAKEALIQFGLETQLATPILTRMLKSKNEWKRRTAIEILCCVHSYSGATVTAIAKALRRQDDWVQSGQNHRDGFWGYGQPWDDAIVKAIKGGWLLYFTAIGLYANLKLHSKEIPIVPVVPALFKALKITDVSISEEKSHTQLTSNSFDLKDALVLIRATYQPNLRHSTGTLRSIDDVMLRTRAPEALHKAGFDIIAVLPDIIEMVNDEDILVSVDSAYTLTRMGEQSINALLQAFGESSSTQTRRRLAGVLGYMGFNAESALPTLKEAMADKNPMVTREVANAISNIKSEINNSSINKGREVLRSLTALERELLVLRLRLGLENGKTWTLEDIAAQFSLTRERIRQIEKGAIQRLYLDHNIGEILCAWRIHNHSAGKIIELKKPSYNSLQEAVEAARNYAHINILSTDSINIDILDGRGSMLLESLRIDVGDILLKGKETASNHTLSKNIKIKSG